MALAHTQALLEGSELNEFEIQAVVNQTALAIAERFGVGVGVRRIAPVEPFEPHNEAMRLERAKHLAAALHHRYGRPTMRTHTVTCLFGAPGRALRYVEGGRLSERQQALIAGLERFCAMKGIRPVTEGPPLHDRLQLNNVEAAELATTRGEIGTFADVSWRELPFLDLDSFQRFEVANTLGPLLEAEGVVEYAENHFGGFPSTAGEE